MKLLDLCALLALTAASPPQAKSASAAQRAMLKDWTLARCIGRGLGPSPARDDAYASASALLERGDYEVEVYNQLDMLIGPQLAKAYGGSVPGNYVMLKCLDLYHGAALDRMVAQARATPLK